MSYPVTSPPSSFELLNNLVVQAAMDEAWLDSLMQDPIARHEEGGWIYVEFSTGLISIRRAPAGGRSNLDLSNPPVVPGSVVVGTFHTHPNPTAEGWVPGPSTTDNDSANRSGVPWLIQADDGRYETGPTSRRGGLAGPGGYPF